MESDQTGNQYGQVELAGERFQGGQRSCRWINGNDVSVPQGGQVNEAVIHHLSPSAYPMPVAKGAGHQEVLHHI